MLEQQNIQYDVESASSELAQDGQINIENISGGIPPYNLLWNTGDTTRMLTQLATGDYSVVITDKEGCQKELDLSLSFVTNTSIAATSLLEITVFPNPTSTSQIQLRVALHKPTEFKLNWYNTLGQLLKTEQVKMNPAHAVSLSLPSSVNGLYWLEIEQEAQKMTYKKVWKQ